ncbi:LytR/AlgR family response regulator transcription factor [Pedobacter rhodius]|uniref:LytTR family DNA-binding domain-containing protein n=1 Tax=Pedobacter rhodius TaxID=3004098 RepID=A0ABT4KVF7_9SPHI|nr:LytTR family DNA-binding domain-containing protein [Pedobacter sp. SJ11]MCZ4222920.1 LytTR family DNA-binding domain-containing protein [Pedobacter sp. SJ11]
MKLFSIVIDDEPHAANELETLLERTPGIENLQSFNDVESAITFLNTRGKIDVIFSDIMMPGINGIVAAELFRSHCDFLIFVTAHRDFALQAFDAMAAGYLMKPLRQEALLKQIAEISRKRIKPSEPAAKEGEFIMIKGSNKNSFTKVVFKDIIYIEAMLNYVKITTVRGSELTYIGLKSIEESLNGKKNFLRISRSVIISLDHLDRVDGNTVRMGDKTNFTVGESYRNAFYAFLRSQAVNP